MKKTTHSKSSFNHKDLYDNNALRQQFLERLLPLAHRYGTTPHELENLIFGSLEPEMAQGKQVRTAHLKEFSTFEEMMAYLCKIIINHYRRINQASHKVISMDQPRAPGCERTLSELIPDPTPEPGASFHKDELIEFLTEESQMTSNDNVKQVAEILRKNVPLEEPIRQKDIARKTGLSQPAVSRTIKGLRQSYHRRQPGR